MGAFVKIPKPKGLYLPTQKGQCLKSKIHNSVHDSSCKLYIIYSTHVVYLCINKDH